MASTTFDFPHPFGPTMHVVPAPLNVTTVRSQNDLKPTISTFRSLSKVSPLSLASRSFYFDAAFQHLVRRQAWRKFTQQETVVYSSRGGSFERQVNPADSRIARKVGPVRAGQEVDPVRVAFQNVWQVLSQRPSRLAQGWRYGKKH
jgi:hypothetical protein